MERFSFRFFFNIEAVKTNGTKRRKKNVKHIKTAHLSEINEWRMTNVYH